MSDNLKTLRTVALAQMERFRERALETTDEALRSRYIFAVDMLLLDLVLEDAMGEAEATGRSQEWVKEYSDRRGFVPIFMARPN